MPKRFVGGVWTDIKLKVLRKYLEFYTIALSKHNFHLVYFDAFAGTGKRNLEDDPNQTGFLEDNETESVKNGSAKIALEISRPFHEYVFVEKNASRFRELQTLANEHPDLSSRMRFERRDANTAVQEFCSKTDWKKSRAVMLLDPFGMQVDWSTIEAISRTESVDLWYLLPVGMGLDRMLPGHGRLPDSWRRRLVLVTGDEDFEKSFFKPSEQTDLFQLDAKAVERSVTTGGIERYFLRRLGKVFADVAEPPLRLLNKSGYLIYSFVFCCSNPRAVQLASKVSRWITAQQQDGPGASS